jgi:hypothetical protein
VEQSAPRVVIGMDPHKRSVTIEVMCADETIVSTGRFDTDRAGYRAVDHHDTRPRRGGVIGTGQYAGIQPRPVWILIGAPVPISPV